jgi:hypothetical protein
MQTLLRILPVVAVLVTVGAAIYHVRSDSVERPAAAQVKPAPASHDTLPPSERYAGNSSASH